MKKSLSSLLLCAVLAFGGVEFDGTDDHMNCGSASDIDDLTEFTISAWVKIHSVSAVSAFILGKLNSSQHRGWAYLASIWVAWATHGDRYGLLIEFGRHAPGLPKSAFRRVRRRIGLWRECTFAARAEYLL